MDNNEQFSKSYKKRLVISAVVSSAAYGLIIGGGAAFITALVCWIFNFNNIWVSIGIGLGAAAISGILLYFLKFRPNEHDVARQIDRMGLEERTVTMMDLRTYDSPIVQMQRNDALNKINNVTKEQVRAAFPVYKLGIAASVGLAVAVCAGAAMIVVNGLTGAGVIESPGLVDDPRQQYVTVSYIVEEGGEIHDDVEQVLVPGENAAPVQAIADEGWAFSHWSDGSKNPVREDKNVTASVEYTAIFEEIEEGDSGGDGDSPSGGEEGDFDENAPNPDDSTGGGNSGDSGNGGQGNGDGNQGQGNGSGQGGEEGAGSGSGQGSGSGGGWSDTNNVIDGETNYQEVLDYYKQLLEGNLSSEDIPSDIVDLIEGYFGSL